jgi:hypothetical protein
LRGVDPDALASLRVPSMSRPDSSGEVGGSRSGDRRPAEPPVPRTLTRRMQAEGLPVRSRGWSEATPPEHRESPPGPGVVVVVVSHPSGQLPTRTLSGSSQCCGQPGGRVRWRSLDPRLRTMRPSASSQCIAAGIPRTRDAVGKSQRCAVQGIGGQHALVRTRSTPPLYSATPNESLVDWVVRAGRCAGSARRKCERCLAVVRTTSCAEPSEVVALCLPTGRQVASSA